MTHLSFCFLFFTLNFLMFEVYFRGWTLDPLVGPSLIWVGMMVTSSGRGVPWPVQPVVCASISCSTPHQVAALTLLYLTQCSALIGWKLSPTSPNTALRARVVFEIMFHAMNIKSLMVKNRLFIFQTIWVYLNNDMNNAKTYFFLKSEQLKSLSPNSHQQK